MKRSLCVILPFHAASVGADTPPCETDLDCQSRVHPGSICGTSGRCVNPYTIGGCLAQRGLSYQRVCTSQDSVESKLAGYCKEPVFDYPEIRIFNHNWESAFFQAWILQILLTELLGVPSSIETGDPNLVNDFYDPDLRLSYGPSYDFEAMKRANEAIDCVDMTKEAITCAHVSSETWASKLPIIRDLERQGILEAAQQTGALGYQAWYIPKYTAINNPSLSSYLGLTGQRRMLAETFLRPTTWEDYCTKVSPNNCTKPDDVAQRAPEESEKLRMHVAGIYTGHFRATEKNDCDANPDTCTGHFVDYPCGWDSNMIQQSYHLDIALESNGPTAEGGYTYGQMTEIWAAANATRSNVIMQWWTPEALYRSFLRTDYEFTPVVLPPATQECFEARVGLEDRCSPNQTLQVGKAVGACQDPTSPLHRAVAHSVFLMSHDPQIPKARQSPAFDAIRAVELTSLQLGDIFDLWLKNDNATENFDPRAASCQYVEQNIKYFESVIPRTFPRTIHPNDPVTSDPVFWLSLCVSLGAFGMVVTMTVLTHQNHETDRRLKRAQVEFLYLLLAGMAMVTASAFFYTLPPTNLSCTASTWLLNCGYTLELVPLIIKMAAINRLMSAASRMRRLVLKVDRLFGAVSIVSAVVLTFLIVWTVVDAPMKTEDYQLTSQMTESGESIVETTFYCNSESEAWSYMSLAWHTLLLILATILAFLTRMMPRDVNESHVLAIMIYSHFVFVVLRSIFFGLRSVLELRRQPLYLSLILSCDTIATCLIYFMPKFLFSEDADIQTLYQNAFASTSMSMRRHSSYTMSRTSRNPARSSARSSGRSSGRSGSAANRTAMENAALRDSKYWDTIPDELLHTNSSVLPEKSPSPNIPSSSGTDISDMERNADEQGALSAVDSEDEKQLSDKGKDDVTSTPQESPSPRVDDDDRDASQSSARGKFFM